MNTIEKYKCQDCNYQWGISYATFETPPCPICGEHLYVVEITDRRITDKERLEEIIAVVKSQKEPVRKLSYNDLNWLIKQTALAQALEKENIKLKGTISTIGQMCGEITKFVNESLEGKGNE